LRTQLCDFGLSRVLPVLASASTQAGTPQYMAPEVARGLPISRPTAIDTFGLGIVLHDLAHLGIQAGVGGFGSGGATTTHGRSATSGSEGPLVHVLYTRATQDFAVTIAPHCAPPLAALIQRCLAVDPAERPESAAVRGQLLELAPQASGWAW
jgi:serine/threonine protein kinase